MAYQCTALEVQAGAMKSASTMGLSEGSVRDSCAYVFQNCTDPRWVARMSGYGVKIRVVGRGSHLDGVQDLGSVPAYYKMYWAITDHIS